MAPEIPPTGTVAGYAGLAPMEISAARRRLSDDERAKRFMDARCLYCGGFNHMAVHCALRNKARTLNAAGAELKEVKEMEESQEQGTEQVD